MKIAIIGAGPAGMTAAYQLSKELGKSVSAIDVYEKSAEVGGLSKSISLWEQRVDLGPHRFFSHDTTIAIRIASSAQKVTGNFRKSDTNMKAAKMPTAPALGVAEECELRSFGLSNKSK